MEATSGGPLRVRRPEVENELLQMSLLIFPINGSDFWWTLKGKTSKDRKWICADESINFSGQTEATSGGPFLGKTSRGRKFIN